MRWTPLLARWLTLALCVLPWIAAALPMSHDGATLEREYREGLGVWRMPGKTPDHAACASCHGPDGFEIAAYNFDDATIRRRAAIHISPAEADQVVAMIHAERELFGVKKLLDPMKDRPLQPGGAVLSGPTPEARDAELGVELETLLPTLMHGRVESLDQAHQARDEIAKLNLWTLRIGFDLNRLSEDVFHGPEHATIANWLPDLAQPFASTLYPAEDQYLKDPSDANLWALIEKTGQAQSESTSSAESMSLDKFEANLIMQHLLRRRAAGLDFASLPTVLFGEHHGSRLLPNPGWDFGDDARRFEGQTLEDLGYPTSVIEKKQSGPSSADQLRDIRLPWLWFGFMMDPGLQRISFNRKVITGFYLAQLLWGDGPYPIHNALFETKKIVTQSYDPNAWGSLSPQHFMLDYSALFQNGRHLAFQPREPAARKRYQTFLSNAFRMCIYLQEESMEQTGAVWGRDAVRGHLKSMQAFIDMADPASKSQTDQLVARTLQKVEDSEQRLK